MYKGLPIATNKISRKARKGVPHHLLGCVPLDQEPWTVHDFHSKASSIIGEIRSRGKVPILVGGTHYYTQSLLFPQSLVNDEDQNERLEEEDEERKWPILAADTHTMYDELRRVDPDLAQKWHPRDRRKIRRSLQIWLQTGKRASDLYREQRDVPPIGSSDELETSEAVEAQKLSPNSKDLEEDRDVERYENLSPLVFWTYTPSQVLNRRLDGRVDDMISNGLLEEVKSMHAYQVSQAQQGQTIDDTRGIWVAIGYKEMLPYITSATETSEGETKSESVERMKTATRQYAKRQTRWIHLKLLLAMHEAGWGDKMFLLDAFDLSQFPQRVEKVAEDITSDFLAGNVLLPPTTLSDLAMEMLLLKDQEREKHRSARYCDLCDKTMMYEAEWLKHLTSKGHKKAMKPKIDWKAIYPKQ